MYIRLCLAMTCLDDRDTNAKTSALKLLFQQVGSSLSCLLLLGNFLLHRHFRLPDLLIELSLFGQLDE